MNVFGQSTVWQIDPTPLIFLWSVAAMVHGAEQRAQVRYNKGELYFNIRMHLLGLLFFQEYIYMLSYGTLDHFSHFSKSQ